MAKCLDLSLPMKLYVSPGPKQTKRTCWMLDPERTPVYCHMTSQGLDACGGGGWTLVMKIDGSKVFKDNRFHI